MGPDDIDVVELHDATSAEELYALESLGFFPAGEAGIGHRCGRHRRRRARGVREPERRPGGPGTSAGRDRHLPDRRTGRPAARHGYGTAGARAPVWRRRSTPVGSCPARTPHSSPFTSSSAPDAACPEQSSPGGESPYPTRSSPTRTSRRASTPATSGSPSAPGSASGASAGTTSELAIAAGARALGPRRTNRRRRRRARPRHLHTRRRSCRAHRPPCRRGSGSAGGAFDVNAACSGFVYALVAAHGLVLAGAQRVLVIGSETLSQITDWDDRSIAVLVGDGAGAVLLEATDGPGRAAGLGPRCRRVVAPSSQVRPRRLSLHERQGDLPPCGAG